MKDREPVVADFVRLTSCCRRLNSHFARTQVSRLTRQRLATYLRRRVREGVQPQTVRREFIVLRAALRLACRDGVILRVPSITLPSKGQPRQRVLNAREVRRLRAAARPCLPLFLFLTLGLMYGPRRGAILELTWDRVDFDAGVIDFRAPHPRAARRKNRAVVPLVDRALTKLLRSARRAATGQRVIELSQYQFERRFRQMVAAVGMVGVTPHVLRHTVVTQVSRRVGLERASKLVGHKNITVTQEVYEHLKVGDLGPAARAMATWLRRADGARGAQDPCCSGRPGTRGGRSHASRAV